MQCDCPLTAMIDENWGISTCRRCGVAKRVPIRNVVRYIPFGSSPRAPYSRKKRFLRLLANCYGSRVSVLPTEFVKALQGVDLKTSGDIYKFIRASGNRRFKRYDSVAILTMYLLDKKIQPLDPIHSQWAAHVFSEIEREHKFGETFPAYSYVIECLLKTIGRDDLVEYIHPLKCKRRRAIYNSRYGNLFTRPPVIDTSANRESSRKSGRCRIVVGYTGRDAIQSATYPIDLASQQ